MDYEGILMHDKSQNGNHVRERWGVNVLKAPAPVIKTW